MEIKDTVVEGVEGESDGSSEFLVFSSALVKAAAAAGLHPVRGAGVVGYPGAGGGGGSAARWSRQPRRPACTWCVAGGDISKGGQAALPGAPASGLSHKRPVS